MAEDVDEVRGKSVVIRFEGKRCIHARKCVLGRPDVFVPNAPGAWIHPDAANAEAVSAVAQSCPSGAITYERLDGGPQEQAPLVNVVRVRENGPLAFHGALELAGRPVPFRATLCRCGASRNKPFCDSAHVGIGFKASGEPPAQDGEALAQRDGPLKISPIPDGPLIVFGNLEVVSGTGHTVLRTRKTALCRCGASRHKPFCDGSHAEIGFSSEST